MKRLKFKSTIVRSSIIMVFIIELAASPVLISLNRAYAEDPTSETPTGEQAPTGADAKTYHFNETTGLWENDYYTWNPVTKQTKPKNKPTYSWNPVTKRWDTTDWVYDAPSGKYIPNTIEVAGTTSPDGQAAPSISNTGPSSNNTVDNGGTIDGTGPGSNNQTQNGGSINNTGPGSNNQTSSNSNGSGTFDLFYNATISGSLNSTSHSGDVNLTGNTSAGDATSGMASSMANVINLLQSSWNPNGDVQTFNLDIGNPNDLNADVYGDMYLDPSALPTTTASNTNGDLTVNSTQNAHMTNNIDVDATSGNVSASGNTSVGDATSGSATAIANVVNLINSSIAAGKSFMGNINIYGNYNGDILLPQDTLDALLASNVPRATINTSQLNGSKTTVNNNTSQAVSNNTTASATTGDVDTSGNTAAGNATSGNAGTNITVLNLTGQQLIGKNALLVFVNVMGKWVGMIVNAPEGSTSAALANSGATIASGDTTINNTSTSAIDNNIHATAATGDVDVTRNTKAGNATSGDAKAGINLANLFNSGFSLSDWFGVLFINVFGNWIGSFGVNTAAGNSPYATPVAQSATAATPQVFSFSPTVVGSAFNNSYNGISSSAEVTSAAKSKGVVLAASTTKKASNVGSQGSQSGFKFSTLWPVAILALLAAGATEAVSRIRAAIKH